MTGRANAQTASPGSNAGVSACHLGLAPNRKQKEMKLISKLVSQHAAEGFFRSLLRTSLSTRLRWRMALNYCRGKLITFDDVGLGSEEHHNDPPARIAVAKGRRYRASWGNSAQYGPCMQSPLEVFERS
jgi:hypothetical protein